MATAICHRCGKVGHIIRDCTQPIRMVTEEYIRHLEEQRFAQERQGGPFRLPIEEEDYPDHLTIPDDYDVPESETSDTETTSDTDETITTGQADDQPQDFQ